MITAETPNTAVDEETAPQMEVTSEAPEEPEATTPVVVEEAPTQAAFVVDAPTPVVAEEKPAEEKSEEDSNAAAVTEPKPVEEDTPATIAPAPFAAELKKTEAGPTLKPVGRKAALKDVEPAIMVIH